MSERRKQDRGLGRIQRQIFNTRRLRHVCCRQFGLYFHVIQFRAAMLSRDQAQRIEVQEVGAFKISVAVTQPGSGQGPQVDGPEDKAHEQAMRAQPPGSEPARVLSSVCHGKRFMVMERPAMAMIKVSSIKVQAQPRRALAWARGHRHRAARRDGS